MTATKTDAQLAEEYSKRELSCYESIRQHDVVQRAFLAGRASMLEEMTTQKTDAQLEQQLYNEGFSGDYVYGFTAGRTFMREECERLKSELSESARLLGMGSEREARLMAQVEELKRENDKLSQIAFDEIASHAATKGTLDGAESENAKLRAVLTAAGEELRESIDVFHDEFCGSYTCKCGKSPKVLKEIEEILISGNETSEVRPIIQPKESK